MLRKALVNNRKASPKNDRRTCTAGALGGCLTAVRRYYETEPLLAESYEGSRRAVARAISAR
jgi:hypothetical protein